MASRETFFRPIAEFVGTIAQLALPWRPQIGISCGWVLRCLVKVLALIRTSFWASIMRLLEPWLSALSCLSGPVGSCRRAVGELSGCRTVGTVGVCRILSDVLSCTVGFF